MTPTQIAAPFPEAPIGLSAHSQIVTAADTHEVMREQLDYLIEHAQSGPCGCAQCHRYQRARSVLLELFA